MPQIIETSAYISIFASLAIAVLVGIVSYFLFVRSFEKEWFGMEKSKLNDIDIIKNGGKPSSSEYTDSGYYEKVTRKKVIYYSYSSYYVLYSFLFLCSLYNKSCIIIS